MVHKCFRCHGDVEEQDVWFDCDGEYCLHCYFEIRRNDLPRDRYPY